jgi:hypothetical protein
MKSLRNQIKQTFPAMVLCLSLVFLNSCQTSENDIVFSSEVLLTKDSKIVSLMIAAIEGNSSTISFKSTVDSSQCTEFVYPMRFYVYSDDSTTPEALIINNDEELLAFFRALTAGNQFFITYPVTLLDVDGGETVITDYPDLVGILTMLVDACNVDSDDGSDSGNGSDDDDGSDDDGSDDDGSDDNGSDDNSSDDNSSDDNGSDDNSSDDDGSDDIEYEYCGNGNNPNTKVIICHNGNTICISINAIWGHMAHHSDDYYGSCNN